MKIEAIGCEVRRFCFFTPTRMWCLRQFLLAMIQQLTYLCVAPPVLSMEVGGRCHCFSRPLPTKKAWTFSRSCVPFSQFLAAFFLSSLPVWGNERSFELRGFSLCAIIKLLTYLFVAHPLHGRGKASRRPRSGMGHAELYRQVRLRTNRSTVISLPLLYINIIKQLLVRAPLHAAFHKSW